MTTTFKPIVPFEIAPDRIDQESVEKPYRINLRELPFGTIIEFFGVHLDSKYICLLAGTESDRQIKIWLKGRGNGAIGSIDNLASIDFGLRTSREGVLEVGKNYGLPEFYYDRDDNITISECVRTESYTAIFVKKPAS